MTTHIFKPSLSAALGLLLTLPAGYVILISVLKYVLGFPALFDASAPVLEAWGIKDTLGWNINLLILFGPLVGFLINASALLKVEAHAAEDSWNFEVQLLKKRLNWLVLAFSSLCLLILFVYALGENCRG